MSASTGCMICDDKVARIAVDETLAKGMTGEGTARLMTLRGFKVTAPTVLNHKSHAIIVEPGVAKTRRDLAQLVVDKTIDAIENKDITITDEKLWKNVGPGLKAQAEINRVRLRGDDRQTALKLWELLSGKASGFLAPVALRQLPAGDDPEGEVIDGETVDLD